jgi:Zn-dependent protease/predicted transcriptional regulator
MFGKGIRIFRLLGFDVRVDVSWIIIAVLLTWSLATGVFPHYVSGLPMSTYWWMGAIGMLGLFASVVFHELSHSIVARRFGLPIKGITLFIFGGVSEMEDEPANAKTEFFMAIAGPLASIVAGIAFLAMRTWSRSAGLAAPVTWIFYYLGFINLMLAGFNLLPAFPLDGGRVFRAILWNYKKNMFQATRIASAVGAGFGIFLILAGVFFIISGRFVSGMWWVLIGLFLRMASRSSLLRLEMRIALKGQPVSHFMKENPVAVPPSITLNQLVTDYMYRYHFKMFPVVDGDSLLGCITTNEIKTVPREEWGMRTVGQVAATCSSMNAVSADTDAVEALRIMSLRNKSRLLVVEGSRLVGIISLKDLLQFIALKMDLEGAQRAEGGKT